MERIPREAQTHLDDLTKPVSTKSVMEKDKELFGNSCFSRIWDMTTDRCSMCADNEMCGIMFHHRQKKLVKEMEASMPVLMDVVEFDSINKDELLLWLSLKPRRTGELVERVVQLSKCEELETVRAWVKSYVRTHPRLSVEDRIVRVGPKS